MAKHESDSMQFCEAELVGADFFVSNDRRFNRAANESVATISAVSPSELPFVVGHLTGFVADLARQRGA